MTKFEETFEEYAKLYYKNETSKIDLTEVLREYQDRMCKFLRYSLDQF